MAAPKRSGIFRTNDVQCMSAFWVSPLASPGKFAGATHFPDSKSGPNSLDEVRFLDCITRIPRQIFGGDPFWGSNSGPGKLVEVRVLGRTICFPKQNRRVPRLVAPDSAPLLEEQLRWEVTAILSFWLSIRTVAILRLARSGIYRLRFHYS